MDLHALVLRPGDVVAVRGVVITDGHDFGLLMGHLHPRHLPAVMLDQPSIVRMDDMSSRPRAWPLADARFSEITGTWTGRSLAVSRVVDAGSVPPLRPADLGDGPPGDLAAVLRDLHDMRVIVGISMRLDDPVRTAAVTATNVRMAQDALQPFFEELVVRRALHTDAELEAARSRVHSATPEELLSSIGDSTHDDGVRRATASVQRVTPEMASTLIDVPDTAIDLTVFLCPTTPHLD